MSKKSAMEQDGTMDELATVTLTRWQWTIAASYIPKWTKSEHRVIRESFLAASAPRDEMERGSR